MKEVVTVATNVARVGFLGRPMAIIFIKANHAIS